MKVIENRKKIYCFSAAILLIGFIIILVNLGTGRGAFNYDVEFAGGISITIDLERDFDQNDILGIVQETTGQDSPQVQKVLGTNQVSIKLKSIELEQKEKLVDDICEQYGITEANFLTSDVSATVSGEMRNKALIAVAVSCLVMLLYVSIRFHDFKTGGAAIVALLHDALFMLIVYGVLRIPLNNSFIAAILTILGYSINSTVVIFDRLRENKKMNGRVPLDELIDKSLNQSLTRCIFTSLTTLITISLLYFMGVPSVKEFALPIMIGILCGTYTSLFFAGSILYTVTIRK